MKLFRTNAVPNEAETAIQERYLVGGTYSTDLNRAKTILYEDPAEAKDIAQGIIDDLSGSPFEGNMTFILGGIVLIAVIIIAIFLAMNVIQKAKKRK